MFVIFRFSQLFLNISKVLISKVFNKVKTIYKKFDFSLYTSVLRNNKQISYHKYILSITITSSVIWYTYRHTVICVLFISSMIQSKFCVAWINKANRTCQFFLPHEYQTCKYTGFKHDNFTGPLLLPSILLHYFYFIR